MCKALRTLKAVCKCVPGLGRVVAVGRYHALALEGHGGLEKDGQD